MDTTYLKMTLGESLPRSLCEVVEKRPADPIEYIAQWLYKYVENQNYLKEQQKEAADLERQKIEYEQEQILKEKRKAEAAKLAEKEAEKRKLEEEHAKKETTAPSKLPVVIEAQEPSEEVKTESFSKTDEDAEPVMIEEQKLEEPEKEQATAEEPNTEEEPIEQESEVNEQPEQQEEEEVS